MSRGFAAIALHNPKFDHNIGGACRASAVYGAKLLALSGSRFKREATDTVKAYRHIPVLRADDIMSLVPYDCVPVAVDLVDGATPLDEYKHPERAFYVFGAEDDTLGASILDRCRDKVFVRTRYCMNLAATVNVILYDRCAKRGEWQR